MPATCCTYHRSGGPPTLCCGADRYAGYGAVPELEGGAPRIMKKPRLTAKQALVLETCKRAGKPISIGPENRRTADSLVDRGLLHRRFNGSCLYSLPAEETRK